MGVEFRIDIEDGERVIIARNIVDFVTATNSYARGYVDEGFFSNQTWMLDDRVGDLATLVYQGRCSSHGI